MAQINTHDFCKYLKKFGKAPHVIDQLIQQVDAFETFLEQERHKKLDSADVHDLEAYITGLETKQPGSARKCVRGLALYFRHTGNTHMADLASSFRQHEIDRTRSSFSLKEFREVAPEVVQVLKSINISTTDQLLSVAKTPLDRKLLAERTGLSPDMILELVKLSDLARLPGVKQVRARLYYEAGIDTVEKMAALEPAEVLRITSQFVEQTGFDGIAPLPKEIHSTINMARGLPKIVEYEK